MKRGLFLSSLKQVVFLDIGSQNLHCQAAPKYGFGINAAAKCRLSTVNTQGNVCFSAIKLKQNLPQRPAGAATSVKVLRPPGVLALLALAAARHMRLARWGPRCAKGPAPPAAQAQTKEPASRPAGSMGTFSVLSLNLAGQAANQAVLRRGWAASCSSTVMRRAGLPSRPSPAGPAAGSFRWPRRAPAGRSARFPGRRCGRAPSAISPHGPR